MSFGKFPRNRNRSARQKPNTQSRVMRLESLGERITPAINAMFALDTLVVTGDNQDNVIEISRNSAGVVMVNGGAVNIRGGTPTVANTRQINVSGLGGNDTLKLNETNGALPKALLYGGNGNDSLQGGSGDDSLFGQSGDDDLQGFGGRDFLFGGADNDRLTGGDNDDQVYGESGNDKFIWNPSDDTDLNEGGTGVDTVEVNGGNGTESFTATANGTRVRFDRVDPAPFALDIGTAEQLILNAGGGDDRFAATGNLAALISISVDGGSGNDTLLGSNGRDTLRGGTGMDFVDGQQGDDIVILGPEDDVFQWDPGDGSDTLDGQEGNDKLVFNGSAANETFELSASADRVRLARNLGNIVMDIDGFERIDLHALGGTDTAIINDLQGTDLVEVNLKLAATIDGTIGDGQADTVIVNGTNGNDIIDVFGTGTSVSVLGLSARVNISHLEAANDTVVVNSLGGADGLTAKTLVSGITNLVLNGGEDNDVILGSQGADTIFGGFGNDRLFGQQGDDRVFMGDGEDQFQWEPGHGNDLIEGQDGIDAILLFGSNANENIDISANGGRTRIFRDIEAVAMDLDDVESIEVRALDGADNIVVGDMSGTDVQRIGLDLRGSIGGSDGQTDSIVVNGTQGDDTININGDSGGMKVHGLTSEVRIFHHEQAHDRLTVNALGGNDTVNSTSLRADSVQLTVTGGLGNDTLFGGESNELFLGGDGSDVVLMGAGDDISVWNPGDDNDTIEGQDGIDTLTFNGANVAENIAISPNGSRVQFTRNVASVVLDLNGLENIAYFGLGGADVIVVNDLAGTGVAEVNLDLSGPGGGGDSQPDSVIVNGSAADDAVFIVGNASGTFVYGLAAQVNIYGAETNNDRLVINSVGGNDVVDGSGLQMGGIGLTVDGGENDDIIVGSDGVDVLFGGDGDDVLFGGPGVDVLDGGSGDNIIIPD